jgi:thiamine biosynthesis protein ThiS
MSAVKIRMNGELRELPDGVTLLQLLEELKLSGRPIAVELNLQVVPKSMFAGTPLREGDRLEVVSFVGGG